MVTNYRIFISHSWTYSSQYSGIVGLLRQRPYFAFTDYSVPQHDPIHTSGTDAALYQAIKNKIQLCNVVLILAGVYSSYSKWIDKEIRISKIDFSKPVIAVRPLGNINISSIVSQNADEIVSWNTESIVSAIRKWAI